MFVDYYGLLAVNESASISEIKSAFRVQALKWHPDKNHNLDTTMEMQRINEAYLILKDPEARSKFDIEYQKFKRYRDRQRYYPIEEPNLTDYPSSVKPGQKESGQSVYDYSFYSFDDIILKRWMDNARKQAVDLAKQTIKDLSGMAVAGLKEGAKASGRAFVNQIIIGLIFLIIFTCIRACKN